MTTDSNPLVDRFKSAVETSAEAELTRLLEDASAAELARVIESLPNHLRPPLWSRISAVTKGEVLLELHGDLRRSLAEETDLKELVGALSALQMDELADLDEDLPIPVVNAMVQAMDAQRRQRYAMVSRYADDTAGGLMDVDATAVRADVSLKSVLRYLRLIQRRDGKLPEHLDSLVVVDRHNRYLGILPLSLLVAHDEDTTVSQIMVEGVPGIDLDTPANDVARIFEDQDLLSAAVVNEQGYLVGRITVDDVLDVVRDESDRAVMRRAGLDENTDMFAPIGRSSLRRAVWLAANLLTAFLAAWVIGLFEDSIEKIVALAVLMPVVASMGGVSGSQSLTVVTRGLALNQIGRSNVWRLVVQELGIGSINGLFWAAVVAAIAVFWFGDLPLALIFGIAMFVVLLVAALAGTLTPLVLKKIGIDPALAGGVVLTTITDVVGFFAFLGLATVVIVR